MKTITPDNYLVRPFKTHKMQSYDYTYGGSNNPPQIMIDAAVVPSARWVWNDTDPNNSKQTLYASVQHIFENAPSGSLYVFSISQRAYGEGIRPGTFTVSSPTITGNLTDDSNGRITRNGLAVGVINYKLGVVAVPQTAYPLTNGTVTEVTFGASHTIYEHQVICTMNEGEFNYSSNPSLLPTVPDPFPSAFSAAFQKEESNRILDAFASGSLSPYMTTVGLYTARGELVALGKFPRPTKRVPESQQTVIIRFDV